MTFSKGMEQRLISYQTTVQKKERPSKFEICGNCYGEKNMLKKHQQFVYENEKPIKYKNCQKCLDHQRAAQVNEKP